MGWGLGVDPILVMEWKPTRKIHPLVLGSSVVEWGTEKILDPILVSSKWRIGMQMGWGIPNLLRPLRVHKEDHHMHCPRRAVRPRNQQVQALGVATLTSDRLGWNYTWMSIVSCRVYITEGTVVFSLVPNFWKRSTHYTD